jgi:antitoxin FitA
MNKHLQIRDIGAAQHRKLKVRAASRGISMTDYVKALLERDLSKPSHAELIERAKKLTQVELGNTTVEFLREDRDNR